MRTWALRSYSIRQAAVIMAAAFGMSAILGMLRQVLLGATFGDGVAAAAYYAAARLPETLVNLAAGGALAAAIVPLLVTLPTTAAQQRFVNAMTSAVMIVVIVVSLLGALAAGWFVRTVLLPGATIELQQLTITLTRLLLLQPLLLAIASIVGAVLTAERRFTLIALAYVSHNVTILLGIAAARVWPEIGIYGPTVGLVLAAFLKAGIVLLGMRWSGMTLAWHWDVQHPLLRRALWLAAPTALSVTVNYAGSIVDTAFASVLGATAVASLYSAWLLADMPARLIGSALGQAMFPHVAHAVAQGDIVSARRMLVRTVSVAVALALPVLVVIWVWGRWGIAMVLERGVFDQAAGDRTFGVLQWYIVGLPAFIVTELLSRMLNAMHDTHTPLVTNIMQLLAKWGVLTWWGMQMGIVVVPIAHVVTCYLETVILAGVVWRQMIQRGDHA